MKKLVRKRVLLPLFVLVVIIVFFNSRWLGWIYPIEYKEEIRTHASAYEVDPFLVAAIIRVETNFQPSMESKKGALGVMQLMPNTAQWIMEQAHLDNMSLETVKHEIDPNIQIGTWYLRQLNRQFGGNNVAVIAAYNAGPGNVKSWLSSGKWDGTLEDVKDIPFGETRHYVQRVLYYYKQYTELYDAF